MRRARLESRNPSRRSRANHRPHRTNRDALQAKVDSVTKLDADLEKEIARLQPANANEENPAARAISAAVVAQQKQLEALADASNLKAPTDGIVSAIQKRPGEIVKPGDAVVMLGALRPSRIVAYVRQPFAGRMKQGDVVQVFARGNDRLTPPPACSKSALNSRRSTRRCCLRQFLPHALPNTVAAAGRNAGQSAGRVRRSGERRNAVGALNSVFL